MKGPTLGGLAFAWSSTNGLPFPLDQCFVFYMVALIVVSNFLLCLMLEKKIEKPHKEYSR